MQHDLRIATYSQIFVQSYAPKPIENIDLHMASQRTLFHNGIEPPTKQRFVGFHRNVSQLRPLSLSAQVAVGAQKSFQHPGLSTSGFRV